MNSNKWMDRQMDVCGDECELSLTTASTIATNGVSKTVSKTSSTTTSGVSQTPRSVSDQAIKSATMIEASVESGGQLSGKLNGKCRSVHALTNGHRIPSYVGISCAISGYSNYNRYCSATTSTAASARSSSSRDNSPTITTITHSIEMRSNQEPVNNGKHCESSLSNSHNENISINDNHIQKSPKLVANNSDMKNENINSNISLLQQRIASLYGDSFAANWRESRCKHRFKQNNTFRDKLRSPTCPPKLCYDNNYTHSQQRTKSPPVFHQIDKVFNDDFEVKNKESSKLMKSQTDETPSLIAPLNDSKHLSKNDGNYFLTELSRTTLELQEKITFTEKMLEEQHNYMGEEIAGKLRAAIGKANLLINKKFNQFRELCYKNINQSETEEFVTTNEDLAGFWDMVLIQVIDIKQTFEEISSLYKSGWKSDFSKELIYSPTKSRSKKLATPKGSPNKSTCDSSPKSRDADRRNRLIEAKRRQAKLMAAKNDDDITIFTPNYKE